MKKAEYDQLVEKGDDFYMNKNLPGAKQSYQQALAIYPSESYPRDMIDRINEAMKKQIGADELYAVAISNADKFMKSADYANALQEYGNASNLKPSEGYPKQKIEEINSLLRAEEEAEQNYELAVSMGDQYLNAGSYAEAREQFEKALQIKPGESYPAERLAMAVEALNDQEELMASYRKSMTDGESQLEAGEYDAAIRSFKNALLIMPGDVHADEKIKDAEQRKARSLRTASQYSEIIAEADGLLTAKKLMAAREKYELAQTIDPGSSYPAEQIAVIDSLLEEQRSANATYTKAIAAGDLYFNKGEYEQAKAEYEKASAIKPGESYPQNRLEEITAATAAAAAATTTITSIPAPQEDEYTKVLKEADGHMGLQEYEKAKLLYLKAANMRPKEQYPRDKLEEIDLIVSSRDSEEAEYNRLVSAADRMLEAGNYDLARERYNEALEIRPTEQYPHDKLKVIDEIILANEVNVQKTYNQIIEDADKLFKESDQYPSYTAAYENEQLCPVCSAAVGEDHTFGCPVEVCPWCGGQLTSCNCRFTILDKEHISSEKDLKTLEEKLIEKGRIAYDPVDQRPAYPGSE